MICGFEIEIEDGKLKETMERLDRAVAEIYECYAVLEKLGVICLKEKTASGN